MQNGHDKQQTIQINPVQAAQFALMFLARAPHTQPEREQFDIASSMLQAIAAGQVSLTQPTLPQATAPQPEATQ